MTLGTTPRQGDLWRSTVQFCEGRVAEDSIHAVLHRECFRLFPDSMFADLFTDVGRRSVPPMIVAVVMVLQRIEGLSDREAVDRFAFDARWKYAAGGLDFDYPGFVHTVLVDMRARLARSQRPDRIFEATLEAAKAAGLVGRKRVLDSTPLYDAVATMDTVTLVRSAIRGLLQAADPELEARLRARLAREDDYAQAGKPVCDYDDPAAREALVDALAKDAMSLLAVLDGLELAPAVQQAGQLVAQVVGQDLDQDAEGVFRIARRVAKDRVISTVDPEARHGHKTAARGFDGYKGHVAIDPDSEIITATTVTAGNTGDAEAAMDLLADDLDRSRHEQDTAADTAADTVGQDAADDTVGQDTVEDTVGQDTVGQDAVGEDAAEDTVAEDTVAEDTVGEDTVGEDTVGEDTVGEDAAADTVGQDTVGEDAAEDTAEDTVGEDAAEDTVVEDTVGQDTAEDTAGQDTAGQDAGDDAGDSESDRLAAYGDAAYGAGELLAEFDKHGVEVKCRVQPASAPAGMFSKDRFDIDLDAGTVRCPGEHTVPIRWASKGDGSGTAAFGALCAECPLAARCTRAAQGRSISIGPHQERLAKARKAQADPAWQADYKATRPKVERKIGHLMRRKHGGRRARVRGRTKVAADFALLAASVNLARLGVLGLTHAHGQGWVAAQA